MVRFYTDNLSIKCLGGEILYFNKMLQNPEIVKMAEAGWWVVQIQRSSFYTLSIYLSIYIEAITIEMFKMENLQDIELNGELK